MNENTNFFKKIMNKIIDIIKQFLIIILYLIIIVTLQLSFLDGLNSNNFAIQNLSYITLELIILTIFILIFRKKIVPNYYDFKKNGKKYIKDNYWYWIIGLIIMIISNMIISSFIGLPVNEEANRDILNRLPIYSTIAMVIFAPIIEELMTRAILKDTFKNPIYYIVLSGLIFGSLHVTSIITSKNLLELLYIIPYGALGCAFAKIYSNSNNIWTNILFHSLHNAIAILLVFIGG